MTFRANFRVYWLPQYVTAAEVCGFFKSMCGAAKVQVNDEFMEDFKSIKTGNFYVKVESKSQIGLVSGIHTFSGRSKLYIARMGERPKCFICSSTEHTQIACPKRKCKKKVRQVQKDWARR